MRQLINIDSRIRIKEKDIVEVFPLPVSVTFQGAFNEDNSQKFIDEFTEAEADCLINNQKVLPIVIDSYGGEVYSLLRVVDIIKASRVKVATIAEGKAMSCGAVLFSCGHQGYRFISPNATVMIHEVSTGNWGKNEEVKADAKECDRLNNLIMELMAENCGHEKDYFKKLIHEKNHADWFLSAQECVAIGLANSIGVPTMKIDVKIDYEFGL